MSVGAVAKTFVIRQPEKVSISLRKSLIPRLHCLILRYPNRKKVNQGRM